MSVTKVAIPSLAALLLAGCVVTRNPAVPVGCWMSGDRLVSLDADRTAKIVQVFPDFENPENFFVTYGTATRDGDTLFVEGRTTLIDGGQAETMDRSRFEIDVADLEAMAKFERYDPSKRQCVSPLP